MSGALPGTLLSGSTARCPLELSDYDEAARAHSDTLRLSVAGDGNGGAECRPVARATTNVRAEVGTLQCLGSFMRSAIEREPGPGALAGGTGRRPNAPDGSGNAAGIEGGPLAAGDAGAGEESGAEGTVLVLNQTRAGLGSRLLCLVKEERRARQAPPNENYEHYPTGYSPRQSIYEGTVEVLPLEQCSFTSDGRLTARSASLAQRWHFSKGDPSIIPFSSTITRTKNYANELMQTYILDMRQTRRGCRRATRVSGRRRPPTRRSSRRWSRCRCGTATTRSSRSKIS